MNSSCRLLKRPSFHWIIIWMLNHFPFAIPVKRLQETGSLLAFFHPKPAYPFHAISLPRKAVRSFSGLEPADPFLADLVTAVQSLVAEN
jgi:diadenosine tetraphosphate (Ap4A) HIT family hydrolase